jgi:ribosome biogenesis protein BRX1
MISELSYLHNCNNTLFFEARRHEDLYLWAVKSPNGPSIRMHVQNIHTMDELKMTGNCLKGSRGIVSFDAAFDQTEWGRLTKEVFAHVSYSYCCLRAIWELIHWTPQDLRGPSHHSTSETIYRPYPHLLDAGWKNMVPKFPGKMHSCIRPHAQKMTLGVKIVEKDPLQPGGPPQTSLVEIGPRFVLTPIRVFEGAFNGATIYSNPGTIISCASLSWSLTLPVHPEYVSPSAMRQAERKAKGIKYKVRKAVENERATRKGNQKLEEDELAVRKVFA